MPTQFESFDIRQLCNESPFSLFFDRWALLTAGTHTAWNTMTVSGGQLGILWSRNVATVYVRPQRHTLRFMDENEYFTLSFFDAAYKDALRFCGVHSGRDTDKAAATGLVPLFRSHAVWFEQAETVLVCRKLYRQPLSLACFTDKTIAAQNYHNDYHIAFVGEITEAYRRSSAL